MEYFKIRKKNGSIVSCVREIPGNPQGIVIAVHGFTSSKESSTYRLLLERLPSAGFGVIGIDLPGHGTEESEKQQLLDLETKGYFDTSLDDAHKPVRVTGDMYNDLLQNDLFGIFDTNRFGEHQIVMAHGEEDNVIDPKAAERFSAIFGIPVTWFPGEGHSLSNNVSTPGRVVDLAIQLYKKD